jgi:hypothetical protein
MGMKWLQPPWAAYGCIGTLSQQACPDCVEAASGLLIAKEKRVRGKRIQHTQL